MATSKTKTLEPTVFYSRGKRHTRQKDGTVIVEEKRSFTHRTSGKKITRWVRTGYIDNE